MHMEKDVHGFSPNDVVELYRYLCIYENKLEEIPTQEDLIKKHTKLIDLEKVMSAFVSNYCTKESLKVIALAPVENLVSMTKCRSSKVLSFLHHLRNSIAHGLIEQEDGFVYFIDYGKNKKGKDFSARGKIKSSTLFEIISIINANINIL